MSRAFFTHYDLHLRTAAHPEGAWQPAVDLYRGEEGWLLKFELAGVRQEDIQVRLDARGVTVYGTRLDRRPYEFPEAHLIEIAYSQFERCVPLPEPVEDVQFRLEHQDGMLFVYVLKSAEPAT